MNVHDFEHKKVLIIGYGREGASTEVYLRKMVKDIDITIADQKDSENYLHDQHKFDIRIRSAGIPKHLIVQPYTTATNIFFGSIKGTKIGVTGTKGKSTTSTLIYEILKLAGKPVHLVGNIGKPWFDDLGPDNSNEDIYVCELSSYQLDDIEYSPEISVFVSFFPEHMNYHGSVEAYWQAKSRIIQFSKPTDYFVYNPNVEMLRKLASETQAKAMPYISTDPIAVSQMSLIGEHNQENIRAARTVASIFHIEEDIIRTAISRFTPLPHRLQNIGTYKGITFYDDAISTTPESTICALRSLENISVLFLGGLDRGYDFQSLVALINQMHIRNIVLFPDSGEKIENMLQKASSYAINILKTSDMKEAVRFAYAHAPTGTICLLSTASPSYSVWKNFEEKGELFARYIQELAT